jgi:hypothetical protein
MVRETHGRASSAALSSFSRERLAVKSKRSMDPSSTLETYRQERRGPQNQQYSATSQRQTEDLVCDYDQNVTPLYELLESSQWDQARLKSRTHPEQVQTWIVRRDEQHRIKWKLLPLHAAVIFQAPVIVIEALLQEYPEAVQQRDDQGMLPLHLAFRHTLDDSLVEFLLQQHIPAVSVQDKRGRIPLDHAGDRRFSGAFLNAYAQAIQNSALSRSAAASTPDLSAIRAHYEDLLASVHQEHEQSLVEVQKRMGEEQQAIRVFYEQEFKELRDKASKRDVHGGEVYHQLQDALKRVSADNQILRNQLQEQQAHYEDIQAQMKLILQDQMTLTKYCEQQQQELVHAQELREELLRSLSAQKETSSSARQISKLSESIRLRTEALLLRPEPATSPKVARGLSSPRVGATRTSLTYADNERGWGGSSVQEANDGDDGDDVSAITDENNYQY